MKKKTRLDESLENPLDSSIEGPIKYNKYVSGNQFFTQHVREIDFYFTEEERGKEYQADRTLGYTPLSSIQLTDEMSMEHTPIGKIEKRKAIMICIVNGIIKVPININTLLSAHVFYLCLEYKYGTSLEEKLYERNFDFLTKECILSLFPLIKQLIELSKVSLDSNLTNEEKNIIDASKQNIDNLFSSFDIEVMKIFNEIEKHSNTTSFLKDKERKSFIFWIVKHANLLMQLVREYNESKKKL